MIKKSDKFKDAIYVWDVIVKGELIATAYDNHDAYELLKVKLLEFIDGMDREAEEVFWKNLLKDAYKKNSDKFGITVYGTRFQCKMKAVSREEFDKWL